MEKGTAGTESNASGWRVTFAALGINLALGILYTWSVIGKGIPDEWEWSQADRSWPYAVACLVFSLVMVPAGRMQDRFGPRLVASLGGILVGVGMVVASATTTPMGYVLGFGVLAGAGIGFGYAAATPPAVKWFPAAKTGLIAGIVVSGFGLAPVYAAPLSKMMIGALGVTATVMWLGIAFTVVVVGCAQLLAAPPEGYRPPGTSSGSAARNAAANRDYTPAEMLRTPQFYILWFMYACGAGAGLMIISKLATIADVQAGIAMGSALVAVLAVGNGAGRVAAGVASDKLGRTNTLLGCFLVQALLIALLSQTGIGSTLANPVALGLLAALIGANYGANLTLFPTIAKEFYGLRNFGVNYGLLFTAWGIGGFSLALLAGWIYDRSGSFNFAYYCSSILLVAAAIATAMVRPPSRVETASVVSTEVSATS